MKQGLEQLEAVSRAPMLADLMADHSKLCESSEFCCLQMEMGLDKTSTLRAMRRLWTKHRKLFPLGIDWSSFGRSKDERRGLIDDLAGAVGFGTAIINTGWMAEYDTGLMLFGSGVNGVLPMRIYHLIQMDALSKSHASPMPRKRRPRRSGKKGGWIK